jgi:hypothetical protein
MTEKDPKEKRREAVCIRRTSMMQKRVTSAIEGSFYSLGAHQEMQKKTHAEGNFAWQREYEFSVQHL